MTDTQKQPASVPFNLVTQWLNDWGNSGCLSVLQFIANRAAAYGREQAAAELAELHAKIGDLLAISAAALAADKETL